MAEECEKLVTTIKQMHIGLDGKDATHALDDELQVTYPLQACLQELRDKHKTIAKLHRERYEQVKSTFPLL
jgi:Ase1/PRC1/MAP65 family protein